MHATMVYTALCKLRSPPRTPEMWSNVLWTDAEILGSNRRQYVQRRCNDRLLQPSVMHGGGPVQVWGYITTSGVSDLLLIEAITNADIHKQIPSGKCFIGNKFVLQQDNGHRRTAKKIKTFLSNK